MLVAETHVAQGQFLEVMEKMDSRLKLRVEGTHNFNVQQGRIVF